jgi:PAS domain S-box-containing protein
MSDKDKSKKQPRKERAAPALSSAKKKPAAKKRAPARPARPSSPWEAAAFQKTFDLAAVGIGHLEPGGRWSRVNRTLCEIVGYSRNELLERSLLDIVFPDDSADARSRMEQLLRGDIQTGSLEMRVVRKDGFVVMVNLAISAEQGPGGKISYLIAVIEDITGRRRMEEGLSLFRTAVQSLPLGVTITDLNGKVIFMNPSEARMHGYAVDELLGRAATILGPAQQDGLSVGEMISRNIIGDVPFTRDATNVRRDGTVFPVNISSVVVRDMRGTPLGLISVSEDITERQNMMEALRESEQQYRSLFESASDAIFITDHESGILTDCNLKAVELLGMTREEVVGMHQSRMYPPDEAEAYRSRFSALNAQQRTGMFHDYIVCRKDGRRVWVDISANFFESGRRQFVMGIFRDVSQRKLAEEQFVQWMNQLRDSESRFRELADLLPQPVFETNLDGVLSFANQSAFEYFGYGYEDFSAGINALQMISPAEREPALVNINRILQGETVGAREYTAIRKNGEEFPVIIVSSLVVRDGKPAGLRGIIIDITERKRAEEEVRQSRGRLQLLIDRMPLGFILWTRDFRVELWNPTAETIFGYSAQEAIGRSADELIVPPDVRPKVGGIWDRLWAGDTTAHSENENVTKDGRRISCSWYNTPLTASDGSVVGALSMVQDVTERRRIETAITQSKQDWEDTFDTITDMITIHDENFNIIRSNKAAAKILGLPWLEMGKAKCFQYYHGTDCPPERCPSCESFRTGKPSVHEMYEGHLGRYLEIRGIPRHDERGKMVGLIHVVRDITTRKKAEDDLRASEEKLKLILENAGDAIYVISFDGEVKYINSAASRISGYGYDELMKRPFFEFLHPDDRATVLQRRRDRLTGKEVDTNYAFRIFHRSGAILWVEVTVVIITWEGKPATLNFIRDVTDRKQAETEKALLEAQLREAQKMQVIGNLAGGVAHEVRNPLNAIMALTDALDQEIGGNPEFGTFMMHMRTQVERLTALMNDLLELGRPVERSLLRQESLAEICALSIDAWKQSKWGKGREVVLSRPADGKDVVLLADAKKLQQVFINLLDNAAQHSPDGGAITIEVLAGRGNETEVRVTDRGAGIPAAVLPRIFDTFFTTRRGGTGLGLNIVKHIVETHGGRITLFNNEPPPGCTAAVNFPLRESAVP